MASLTFPQRREKKTASRKKKQRCENKSIVAHVFLATPSRDTAYVTIVKRGNNTQSPNVSGMSQPQ